MCTALSCCNQELLRRPFTGKTTYREKCALGYVAIKSSLEEAVQRSKSHEGIHQFLNGKRFQQVNKGTRKAVFSAEGANIPNRLTVNGNVALYVLHVAQGTRKDFLGCVQRSQTATVFDVLCNTYRQHM